VIFSGAMKAVFIVYNQASIDKVLDVLRRLGLRGYTQWEQVKGVGSDHGEPHLGSHTWPAINTAMLVVCEATEASSLMQELKAIDESAPEQGLRAYCWDAQGW